MVNEDRPEHIKMIVNIILVLMMPPAIAICLLVFPYIMVAIMLMNAPLHMHGLGLTLFGCYWFGIIPIGYVVIKSIAPEVNIFDDSVNSRFN